MDEITNQDPSRLLPEARSFARSVRVSDFAPVDPKGLSDRELMEASVYQNQTLHRCLESHVDTVNKHIAAQQLMNLSTTEYRKTMDDRLDHVTEALGDVRFNQDVTEGVVKKLGQMIGSEKLEPGEKRPKANVSVGWKEHLKLAGTMGGSIGLLIFAYQLLIAVWPAAHAYLMSLRP